MMVLLAKIFGGGVIGALFGLIGTAIQSFMEYKTKKLVIEEKRIDREYDLKELETEATHAEKLAVVRANHEIELSADDNFRSSIESDSQLQLGPIKAQGFMAGFLLFTEGVRRITRPALTWYLTAVVTALAVYMTYELYKMGVEANEETMVELLKYIITATVTVFCTAVTWWFGSRFNKASKIS